VQFDSLAAAFEMGGHGPYVWAVALLTVLVVAWLLLAPTLGSRRLLAQLRGAARRQHQQKQLQEDRDASGT
jgi:heme exporter protein D